MFADELESSLSESLRDYLNSETIQLRDLMREFFNIKIKNVAEKPRSVFWSDEVKNHPLYKNEKKSVIDLIAKEIEVGESIHRYLSPKSDHLRHTDNTLSCFDIHHLHLGAAIETKGTRKGRVKGTKSLLFAMFNDDSAYFVDIFTHDIGFLNPVLLRTIYKNWPDILEPFRIKRDGIIAENISKEDYEKLLSGKDKINAPIELAPGKVYFFPGGGITCAGTAIAVEDHIRSIFYAMEEISNILKSNLEEAYIAISQETGIKHSGLRLRARILNDEFDFYDSVSGCSFIRNENGVRIISNNNLM